MRYNFDSTNMICFLIIYINIVLKPSITILDVPLYNTIISTTRKQSMLSMPIEACYSIGGNFVSKHSINFSFSYIVDKDFPLVCTKCDTLNPFRYAGFPFAIFCFFLKNYLRLCK